MPDISSVYAAAVDLDKPIVKTILRDVFVTEDKEAHTFRIKLNRSGSAVDLSGAQVTGYFMRYKDRVSIPQTGSVEGDTAVLTLSAPCYNYSTTFALTICVKIGNVKHAVFVGEGQMYANRTDSIVDPEHVIPSIEDIIAQYGLMKEGTDAANEAAANASTAVVGANTAAAEANAAAVNANEATVRANTAAEFLENAPVPTGTIVKYQAGTNPDVPPTGEWLANPPSVPQGQYLWTRTVQSFTNGNPVTSYSVARQGMDGSGSVASVDGVSPDSSGNVPLGAVRSVNGSMPDEDGNVTIEAGGGDVQTVDGIAPDPETGDVPLNAANRDTYMLRLTAEEYEARTLAQSQQDYADGVRGYLVGSSDSVRYGYVLNEGGTTTPQSDPGAVKRGEKVELAADSEMLGGKPASAYFLAEDAAKIEGIQMELLWENASPASGFAEQVVDVNFDGFAYYMITYNLYYSTLAYGSSGFIPVGKGARMFFLTDGSNGPNGAYRDFTFTTKKFGTSISLAGGSTNADRCIPYRIYGVKGVPES